MAKSVVLIDDDQDDLEILKETISALDSSMHCLSFIYPEEAVRLLTQELIAPPDFIFIDINMPKKSGIECLADIRKSSNLDNSVVTILSTSMPQHVAKQLLKQGANFALEKPILVSDYSSMLSNVFSS